jgi:hypothetical protein
MFGRAPIQFSMPPRMVQGVMPAPQPVPPTTASQPANPQWGVANPSTASMPKPVFRAQAEDPPASTNRLSLRLPSPEELGIPAAKVESAERTFADRIQRLGATGLLVEQASGGAFRVRVVLPGARPVEAEGTSRDAALNLALDRAELAVRP